MSESARLPKHASARRFLAGALLLSGLVAAQWAEAQEALESPDAAPPQTEADKSETGPDIRTSDTLETLFHKLKRAPSSDAAKSINHAIQVRWMESGSDTVDLLMHRAMKSMESKDYPLALDLLDAVIDLKPGFAEGWNKRATVYYLIKDFGRSMGDIEQTLKLEPRHFGALSGLASIFRYLDRDKDALEVYERTLEINPRLEAVQKAYQDLLEEIEGSDI